jgi:hypothetical protein
MEFGRNYLIIGWSQVRILPGLQIKELLTKKTVRSSFVLDLYQPLGTKFSSIRASDALAMRSRKERLGCTYEKVYFIMRRSVVPVATCRTPWAQLFLEEVGMCTSAQ